MAYCFIVMYGVCSVIVIDHGYTKIHSQALENSL